MESIDSKRRVMTSLCQVAISVFLPVHSFQILLFYQNVYAFLYTGREGQGDKIMWTINNTVTLVVAHTLITISYMQGMFPSGRGGWY